MSYYPSLHHRRSIRLKGNYSQEGLYFITICCRHWECLFGKIVDGEMILNDAGKIAFNEWAKLPERFSNVELDAFQIMPNHIHGIIVLNPTLAVSQNDKVSVPVGATLAVAQNHAQNNTNTRATARVAPTDIGIPGIIGAYKSLVANGCLKIYKSKNKKMSKLWQRNYYEHIIRNEQSLKLIIEYIVNNPNKWNEDKFYKE